MQPSSIRCCIHSVAPLVLPTQEDGFVSYLTEGQPIAPGYFAFDVHLNVVSMKATTAFCLFHCTILAPSPTFSFL